MTCYDLVFDDVSIVLTTFVSRMKIYIQFNIVYWERLILRNGSSGFATDFHFLLNLICSVAQLSAD